MQSLRRISAGLLAVMMVVAGAAPGWSGGTGPPAPGPPSPAPAQTEGAPAEEQAEATPPRISYLHGEVSFWRPGAQDWAPATLNMPLAPGDVLYAGPAGNVELQIGPRAFVRAAYGAQLGLDNQEPDFVQLRVTSGYAAVDLRELAAGHSVELATPGAAFTMDRAGYYHAEVGPDSTIFRTHRGGVATMTPAGGAPAPVASNQQVQISGGETPRVETATAGQLSAWDRWNYQRSDYLVQPASAKYVSSGVYGGETLDQHGSWRSVETYGSVWVPASVPAGWSPYSTGRWIWDPRFGWTWLDDYPWGWAPYHYGRWVFVGPYWAWAPGPIIVRPVYAPALVVFLGGPVVVGRPLYWAPLGWGEPVIRWWGHPRFVGVAWWGGWGGPRVVNNVVVSRTTTVNVTNITVYRNVTVTNAVVGVSADRFGHGGTRPTRLTDQAAARQLAPVRGAPDVRPVAASLAPGGGAAAARPPDAVRSRAVVATRAPQDPSPALRAQGLPAAPATGPQPQQRIVPAPARAAVTPPPTASPGSPARGPGPAGRAAPDGAQPRERARGGDKGDKGPRQAAPDDGQTRERGRGADKGDKGARQTAPPDAAVRQAPSPRPAVPGAPPAPHLQNAPVPQGAPPAPRGREEIRGEPKGGRPAGPAERPGRAEQPPRGGGERGGGDRGGPEKGGGPKGERDR